MMGGTKQSSLTLIILILILTFIFAIPLTIDLNAQVEDTTPPELVEFSFTPTTVDVSSAPQMVACILRITDDLSGFKYGIWRFTSPSGEYHTLPSIGWVILSGDARDGVYRATLTVPAFSEAGLWYIPELEIRDAVGNRRYFTETDLIGLGFPTKLEITSVIEIDIDIKPGSYPNCFNSDGHGVIPVAVLSTDDFDATQVDPATVSLDGQGVRVVGKGNTQAHIEDVNGDGLNDLMVQIEDLDGSYEPGDSIATLTGETFDGRSIQGTDSICIVQ